MTIVGPETFRVHPQADGVLFFLVFVSDTLAEMRAKLLSDTGSCAPDQLGCCVAAEGASDETVGVVGVIYLSREKIGAGLAVHELGHAAFRACERIGLHVDHWDRKADAPNVRSSEETFCCILERLTAEFWARFYERWPAEEPKW